MDAFFRIHDAQTMSQIPLHVNSDRLQADFDQLALIGRTADGGINRLALSSADLQARAWLADLIEKAGFALKDDDAGNLSGVLYSPNPHAKTLVIGSHLDSVPNGGRFDGSVGICAALECMRVIAEKRIALPFHLELVNFTDDEGCWQALFGSRAFVGALTADDMSDLKQDNGPFRASLTRAGMNPRDVFKAKRDVSTLVGYLELHIEHGTRLERAEIPVGVVTGIVGRSTHRFTFDGRAGNSGTTDMYKRRDALLGAAHFIVRSHELIRARYGDGIFNCGDVEVKPGAFNIIPERARLLVEFRHANEMMMNEMQVAVTSIARECAVSYDLDLTTEVFSHLPAAHMSAGFMSAIETSAETLGLQTMPLVSYAGHAAQFLGRFMPSGMIFIPSVNGVGHHPREFTEWEDVVHGANVLLNTVLKLAHEAENGER